MANSNKQQFLNEVDEMKVQLKKLLIELKQTDFEYKEISSSLCDYPYIASENLRLNVDYDYNDDKMFQIVKLTEDGDGELIYKCSSINEVINFLTNKTK